MDVTWFSNQPDFHDPTKKTLSHQQEEPESSDQPSFIIPMSSAHRENNATTPPGEDAVKTN